LWQIQKLLITKFFAMKKINYQPAVFLSLLLTISTALFSFSSTKNNFGGEGFEVYLNDKLVLQQYGKEMNQIKNLQLDQSASNGQLSIRYYHCGKPGTSRIVTIKDEQNVVLKEWKFGDAKDASAKVSCSVRDILTLPKIKAGKKVNLYYAAGELPNGRLLATLTSVNKSAAQP
jgi:hypothetical protein